MDSRVEHGKPHVNTFIGHLTVSLVALAIFLANISVSGLWYPDAPSHALNGLFYMDMIEEGGFLNPRSYAERYYVQYPALTIGTYPPVFYAVEALFFKLLGISPMVPRLAILFFTLLGANVFLLLCRLWFPLWLSVVGAILYLFQPATLFGQKNVMLEMPAMAVSIIALYFLFVGTKKASSWALFLTPVFMALAFLTKQSAIFLLLIWFGWVTFGRKWKAIKSGYSVSGVLIGTMILIPWIIVSLTVGKFYVFGAAFKGYHIWSNFLFYFRNASTIVSYYVIALSVFSVILFMKLKNEDSYKFAICWIAATMLCLLLYDMRLVSAEPRQAMFVIPALVILSMNVISLVKNRFRLFVKRGYIFSVLLIVLICLHVKPQAVWGGRDVYGFRQAADFVVRDQSCISVLYDGYFNSNFTFHMRLRDEDRRTFVFRASKLIFSTKWMARLGYYEQIKDVSKFYDIINRYSIKYIVQEERDVTRTPGSRRLRQWIQAPNFRLVQEYPVSSRGFKGPGSLLVYEYLRYEAKPFQQVELDMPVLGGRISVNIEDSKEP